MNAIPGRVYALDRDTRSDLNAIALTRAQDAWTAALAEILTRAATDIKRNGDAPICWPVVGHDLASTLEMLLRDLMPDELAADVAGAEAQLTMRGM